MKLRQLRYLLAVVQCDLNISAAAEKLHTSQPGISRQIILLEEEVGFQIFQRQGRNLARITAAGQRVIHHAQRMLLEVEGIQELARNVRDQHSQTFSIGTTHTHARYLLPAVIQKFRAQYPDVRIHLHQGTSEQIADMFASYRVDYAITCGNEAQFGDVMVLPFQRQHHVVVVPQGHPLTGRSRLTLKNLCRYPIIGYRARFEFDVAITAPNADVIKAYVRLGLGVGILMDVSIEERDTDLVVIDAAHLFPDETSWIGLRRGTRIPLFLYDFIQVLAPHLDRTLVDQVHRSRR